MLRGQCSMLDAPPGRAASRGLSLALHISGYRHVSLGFLDVGCRARDTQHEKFIVILSRVADGGWVVGGRRSVVSRQPSAVSCQTSLCENKLPFAVCRFAVLRRRRYGWSERLGGWNLERVKVP